MHAIERHLTHAMESLELVEQAPTLHSKGFTVLSSLDFLTDGIIFFRTPFGFVGNATKKK
jgi:hypothetical protein